MLISLTHFPVSPVFRNQPISQRPSKSAGALQFCFQISGPKESRERKIKQQNKKVGEMGRGVSAGGGQSSLGYLFGNGESADKAQPKPQAPAAPAAAHNPAEAASPSPQKNGVASSAPKPIDKQIPAGIHGSPTNNYFRADGQNCGNFITDRPSTKVHSAPGGGSSLGYLFGGGGGGK